ncbi:TetR/AcrR family transcriptional regulator [Oceanobacillus sojae]|uniref:TetR/AcrR family transcriptional regulator n=1 Tax=Oceanobacillus sojae TaxID=582851 RepID=UPI00362B9900
MKKNLEVLSKEQILIATEETIRRFGVDKTSVTDVAKALNVSHGTIYRHFKSKAKLLEGTTEKWLNETIIAPLTAVYEDHSLKGAEALKTYIQTLIELKRSYAHHEKELFDVYAKVTEEAADLVEQHINRMTSQMSEMIELSDFRVSDPDRLAQSIFLATTRFHHPSHAYEWDSPTINQEFLDLWDLLEKGFLNKK